MYIEEFILVDAVKLLYMDEVNWTEYALDMQ